VSQEDVIAFLSDGASYGRPAEPVERIETHCSIVFLVGDKAYKLKRAIAFSLLDYTTLDRRELACRRELELNRRTAPDLYLDVKSIRRTGSGALEFEGQGAVVDWLVVMRRFDQDQLFDRLAASGRLDTPLALALAQEIARFHANAEPTDRYGGREGLMRAIERNNFDQTSVGDVLDANLVERLYAESVRALDHAGGLLDRRKESGRVRRCHGDLRLANIVRYDGRPTLFDAIEFAEESCSIDVLYDLAFVLMDLWQSGLHAQANAVLNCYLDATGDDEGLPVLPLMLSLRAGTRAFAVAGASRRRTDAEESRRLAESAQGLMSFALSLLAPGRPRLVAIGGTTSDDALGRATALAPTHPAPGARIYGAERKPLSWRASCNAALAAGYAVIVAGSFRSRQDQEEIGKAAEARSVPFTGLWIGNALERPEDWRSLDGAEER